MLIKAQCIGMGFAIGLGSAVGLACGLSGCGGGDADSVSVTAGSGGASGSNSRRSGGHGAAGANAGNGATGQAGSNSDGGVHTTLPAGVSGKKLSELSPAEALQTCQAIGEQGSAAISDEDAARIACTLLSVLLNSQPGADGMRIVDIAKCEQSVDDCVMQGGATTTRTTKADCDPSKLPAQFMDCDALVSELTECVDASLATTQMLLDQLTCENVSAMPASSTTTQTVPECETLQAKCPSLLLSGSSDSASSKAPSPTGCDNTCSDANDGFCDDGGPRSESNSCGLGTDCADCGAREMP